MSEAIAVPGEVECRLCGVRFAAAPRCPACGLYRGDAGEQAPAGAVTLRLVAGFGAVYLVTLLIVALAR